MKKVQDNKVNSIHNNKSDFVSNKIIYDFYALIIFTIKLLSLQD